MGLTEFWLKLKIMKTTIKRLSPVLKLWVVTLIVFTAVTFLGDQLFQTEIPANFVIVLRAALLSSIVATIVWWYIKKEKQSRASIGLQSVKCSSRLFLLGMGLILVPLLMTLLISSLAGWASYEFNPDRTLVLQQLLGILVIFLFEAFPEEMIFRGLIFGKLSQQYSARKSLLITSLLFVLFPVFSVGIQQLIFAGPVTVGGSSSITGSYLIYMTIFAFVTGFIRILTKNIWTSIGFHMVFVSMNQILGLSQNSLIVIKEQTRELPIQITLLAFILMLIGAAFAYFNRQKRQASLNNPPVIGQ